MSKWQPTPMEYISAVGVAVVAGASADPIAILPALGLCAGAVFIARRSERLGRLAGETPARYLLVDGDAGSESTKLAVPAKELKRRQEAAKGDTKAGPFRLGALNSLMANISSQAQAADVQKSAQAEEVNPEKAEPVAAQATEKAQKADKPAKQGSDAEWVASASAGVPDGLERGKVASLRLVVERLNKLVDDFPHLFVVGDSGAGKTTLVQLIVGTRPGKVVILDQKRPKGWEGPKWGGLPYVARDRQSSSYKPLVSAMQQVVTEMTRRYRMQDEATEPFEMLTVVLDEAKNSVEECEELAELYRKIVSIGREVNVRLILISTTDRARKLGFDGEADSMDSFAWVVLGEMALKIRPELSERGKGEEKQKVYWALASFAGGWVSFENEKAFSLLPSLNLKRTKAWGKAEYNCQTEAQAVRKAQDDEWPEERVPAHRNFAMVDADAGPVRGTRELQAILLADEAGVPAGDYRDWSAADADAYVQAMLAKRGLSVKHKSQLSDPSVGQGLSAQGSALTGTYTAEISTYEVQKQRALELVKVLKEVPAGERDKLVKALHLFQTNGGKVTPAIKEAFGFDGGPRFKLIGTWLRALDEMNQLRAAVQK